jgi:hypothetical protein
LTGAPFRTLRTTNPIENLNGSIARPARQRRGLDHQGGREQRQPMAAYPLRCVGQAVQSTFHEHLCKSGCTLCRSWLRGDLPGRDLRSWEAALFACIDGCFPR